MMRLEKTKTLDGVKASVCYAAAFAFLATFVFEISIFGGICAFLLILGIMVTVNYFS